MNGGVKGGGRGWEGRKAGRKEGKDVSVTSERV